VRATRIADPFIEEALADLLQSKCSAGMRSAVAAIEQDLDDRAWQLQSAAEADQATEWDYTAAFQCARAAGAVKSCFDEDSRAALNETIYEAVHAVGRDERLVQLLDAVVDLVPPGNRWAPRDLAHLFWPRFLDVDGYVLLADHFTAETLAGFRHGRRQSA
jgi:hypothetical protein